MYLNTEVLHVILSLEMKAKVLVVSIYYYEENKLLNEHMPHGIVFSSYIIIVFPINQ